MQAFAEPVPAGDVIIAPTRGRNMGFWWKFALGSGDHRPYEGSQQSVSTCKTCSWPGDHRPYEGSQLDVPAGHPVAVP